jgi:hypothetical protein
MKIPHNTNQTNPTNPTKTTPTSNQKNKSEKQQTVLSNNFEPKNNSANSVS